MQSEFGFKFRCSWADLKVRSLEHSIISRREKEKSTSNLFRGACIKFAKVCRGNQSLHEVSLISSVVRLLLFGRFCDGAWPWYVSDGIITFIQIGISFSQWASEILVRMVIEDRFH